MENYIDKSVAHFKELLEKQIKRAENIKNQNGQINFFELETIKIGTIDGDGIGPIIVNSGKDLLKMMLSQEIEKGLVELKDISGMTIERRLKENVSVPADVLEEIKTCHVILKGPTTTPKGGNIESANVTLRRELDLFANVRPVNIPDKNIDWVFFRENTEGEYVLGSQGIDIPNILSFDFKVTSDEGTRRIAKAAFEYAKNNGKKHVAIVTKANIMKKTDGKFSDICNEIAKEYKDIHTEEWYVDIMAANLINKNMQSQFEVFLLPNLYGDIITDEAAELQGGVGTAGSANIGSCYAMFEAIHGSAPRMLELGIEEFANPSSIFKAIEMLLRHIGFGEKAELLSKAMRICTETEKKLIVTGDKNGASCKEFTQYVFRTIEKL